MRRAVIVSTARTPIGRARKGALAGTDAFVLAQHAVEAAIERSGISRDDIEDLVLAESLQGGGVIARYTAVALGMPQIPGQSVNRHCAGGLAAVQTAVAAIQAEAVDVVVAGGTESLSSMPQSLRRQADGTSTPWMSPSHPATPQAPAFDMTITVGENTAREVGLTRQDVDEWAAYSHGRAVASQDAGAFDDEIAPIRVTAPDGSDVLFERDEHPRRGVTVESLGQLPVLHPEIDGFTVTAGNAGGLNDAAAAMVITSEEFAQAHGLAPLATVRGWATVGVEPARTGMAPITAIPRALTKSGVDLADIALWEVNEAFCSVPAAACRVLGIDPARMNVNGSGASLGHPIAATGSRMVITMLGELRRRGETLGCVSMCAGGGMGSALVLELL
jgi:acetyl-CoA acetyltransferase family protein